MPANKRHLNRDDFRAFKIISSKRLWWESGTTLLQYGLSFDNMSIMVNIVV